MLADHANRGKRPLIMTNEPAGDVTRLLRDWQQGREEALEQLTPIVYQELRRIAASYMRRERPDHTLQATALVHEAFVRLVDQSDPGFTGRAHFMQAAAHIMRQVLVDFARAHRAEKRGSGNKSPLDEAMHLGAEPSTDLLAAHEALERLAGVDPRKARVIELKYFGGLSREEIAEALGLTLATVKRDISLAEAWLRLELSGKGAVGTD
jgi:RNA polymerase sigma factor (TIGR02999 family)